MPWTIEYNKKTRKSLKRLSSTEKIRIEGFLHERLAKYENPRLLGKPMTGEQYKDVWRYRVGSYRILVEFKVDIMIILVVEVGHRRQVYR